MRVAGPRHCSTWRSIRETASTRRWGGWWSVAGTRPASWPCRDWLPKDLDRAAGTVTVLRGKGGRRRTIGLDPGAFAVVERWLDVRAKLGITGRAPIIREAEFLRVLGNVVADPRRVDVHDVEAIAVRRKRGDDHSTALAEHSHS
jgi:site-specific recombinase XerC